MRLITVLFVCFAVVAAAPPTSNIATRVIGGEVVTIGQWPFMANVLFTWNSVTFEQYCGGAILNEQTIITAANCIYFHPASRFRLRVASALASSGGSAINVDDVIPHPFYNPQTQDHDYGLIRTATNISFTTQVQPAKFAEIDYKLDDNELVHAIGFGAEQYGGPVSEQLREVRIFTINQELCARHYSTENVVITNNMLCAGWLDVGGRGQCHGDTGGPLFHNDVLVGVYSFSINCGVRFYPSVNARISRVSHWIRANM